jgi:hypothetical protein
MHIGFRCESQRKTVIKEDHVSGRIILQWSLRRWDGVVWTELIWLRVETNVGLL